MSLLKREPRTVYRVYGEDEYFGHEQAADVAGGGVAPAVDDIGTAAGEGTALDGERARLPYRGPARDLRPLAVGLLAAAVIGVLALVAVATLGRSPSRAPRADAVAATAPGAVEARGGEGTTGGEKSGAERASRAHARVRARVETTTDISRGGGSKVALSRARAHRPHLEGASVSFAGARPIAVAPVAAGLAGAGGQANVATPASRATAEFGFER